MAMKESRPIGETPGKEEGVFLLDKIVEAASAPRGRKAGDS